MSQADYIEIFIPHLPPGINQTYRIVKKRNDKSGLSGLAEKTLAANQWDKKDKSGLAKTPAANRWDKDAALIVGAAAGRFDFEAAPGAEYQIIIRWWGGRHDADAHLKLVQDCVTRKLGFDDRQIKSCVIERCPDDFGAEDDEPQGVQVHLFKALGRAWVTELIAERLGVLEQMRMIE